MPISNPLSNVANEVTKAKNKAANDAAEEERPRDEQDPEPTPEPDPTGTVEAPSLNLGGEVEELPAAEIDDLPESMDEAIDDAGFFQPAGDPFKYRFKSDGQTVEFYNPETGDMGEVAVSEVPDKWLQQAKNEGHLPENVAAGRKSSEEEVTVSQDPEREASVEVGEPKPSGEQGVPETPVEDPLRGESPEKNFPTEVQQDVLMEMGVGNSAMAGPSARQQFEKVVRSLRSLEQSGTLAERLAPRMRRVVGRLSSMGITASDVLSKAEDRRQQMEEQTAQQPTVTEWERRSAAGANPNTRESRLRKLGN